MHGFPTDKSDQFTPIIVQNMKSNTSNAENTIRDNSLKYKMHVLCAYENSGNKLYIRYFPTS